MLGGAADECQVVARCAVCRSAGSRRSRRSRPRRRQGQAQRLPRLAAGRTPLRQQAAAAAAAAPLRRCLGQGSPRPPATRLPPAKASSHTLSVRPLFCCAVHSQAVSSFRKNTYLQPARTWRQLLPPTPRLQVGPGLCPLFLALTPAKLRAASAWAAMQAATLSSTRKACGARAPAGKSDCIGKNLANAVGRTMLALLCARFEFGVAPEMGSPEQVGETLSAVFLGGREIFCPLPLPSPWMLEARPLGVCRHCRFGVGAVRAPEQHGLWASKLPFCAEPSPAHAACCQPYNRRPRHMLLHPTYSATLLLCCRCGRARCCG